MEMAQSVSAYPSEIQAQVSTLAFAGAGPGDAGIRPGRDVRFRPARRRGHARARARAGVGPLSSPR